MSEPKKSERFYVLGTDFCDPAKHDAIIEQILDWLEAQGAKFAPERRRKKKANRKKASIASEKVTHHGR